MVNISDLASQLEILTTLQTLWCVGPADQSSMVVWYDHKTSLNPEGAARDWLAAQLEHDPNGACKGYVAFKSEFYSDTDEQIRAIAQQLRSIRTAETNRENATS
jgi:hypothetical protein